MNKTFGTLYIVAVPIGNYKDITLRALEILKQVQGVICEELREGSTLLKKLGVENQLLPLNEHNEDTQSIEIITRLQQGQSFALVSDCGTPVFADPGSSLIDQVVGSGISVVPVPGPSSLMAALSVANFKIDKFVYGGFLAREDDRRRQELQKLKSTGFPVVLLDTPYRLTALLTDVSRVFGRGVNVILACDLTLPSERIFRGQVSSVLDQVGGKKYEFVLVVTPL
jgi:16S rRNA (cytidine1402-2'-O)-methyltransferase